MNKIIFATILSLSIYSSAQENKTEALEYKPLKNIGIGVRASTLGVGVEATTAINKTFRVRSGLNAMPYNHDFTIDIDDQNVRDAIGYDPEYKLRGKVSFVNGHVLFDINPFGDSLFHVTAGVFLGENKLKADGRLVDPRTGQDAVLLPGEDWPNIYFDDYEIDIKNGRITADLTVGENFVKPYLGIGIGRSLPKKRVGFMFELGAMYHGGYTIKQNGKEVPTSSVGIESFEDAEDITKYLKWWPMVNMQLTYRLF